MRRVDRTSVKLWWPAPLKMPPSIIPFTPPPPIELSEQNGKDLAEILRVYEVFGGFTAVGGYTTSQGEEVEVYMTFINRTIEAYPPLYYIFEAGGGRGAMPVRRTSQAFGAGLGGLLLIRWGQEHGQIDADFDVMEQENQVVFTPDLLSKWGKAFAAWADTTTAAAVHREYVVPYVAPADAGGALRRARRYTRRARRGVMRTRERLADGGGGSWRTGWVWRSRLRRRPMTRVLWGWALQGLDTWPWFRNFWDATMLTYAWVHVIEWE